MKNKKLILVAVFTLIVLFSILSIYVMANDIVFKVHDEYVDDNIVKACEEEVLSRHNNGITTDRSSNNESPYGLTAEELLSLTKEDWKYLSSMANEWTELCTEEANLTAAKYIKAISVARNFKKNSNPNLNQNSLERITESTRSISLNSAEISLMMAHPIEAGYYVSISDDCIDMAYEIYTQNSCWYDGNGDAFRHISWSALLYCKFYDLNSNSKTVAEDRTLAWTYAHEGYDEDDIYPSAYDTSLQLETQMDLYNNLIGMMLADIRIDMNSYSQSTIFTRAEIWTDNGNGKRIEEDIYNNRYLCATTNSEKN